MDPRFFHDLFAVLSAFPREHCNSSPLYRLLREAARRECAEAFAAGEAREFGPFGSITLPYFKMGAIDSIDLFGIDELIIFAFYHLNRARYRKVVDFGANIGLHSIILSRCGYDVRAFEPDPVHAEQYEKNGRLNRVTPDLHRAAVSLKDGRAQFVRVVGNTTGSHISGAKDKPYGPLESFEVTVEAAAPHLAWAQLAKIDIEGHEGDLICGLAPETWKQTDAILEIGTPQNASRIFEWLHRSPIAMFSQKTGWARVARVDDLPFSHRDGSVFLTVRDEMPWSGV